MNRPVEIYFSGGQNTKVAQDLLLTAGEVQSLVNADLASLGLVRPGKSFKGVRTFGAKIHSLLMSEGGNLYVGEGANLHDISKNVIVFSDLSRNAISGTDYGGWFYMCDGTTKKKFYMSDPSISHNWGINNPTVGPTVEPGAVVKNGTFDNISNWTAGNGAELTRAENGQEGSCLKIKGAKTADPYAYQDLSLSVDAVYTVKLYVKKGTEATWRAHKEDSDGSNVIYFNGAAAGQEATSKFVQHTLKFKVTDSTTRVVLQQISLARSHKTIFFDEIECFQSIIENGTFDSDTENWAAENNAVLASTGSGIDGNCLRITEGGADNPMAVQEVSTVIDRLYTINIGVKKGTGVNYTVYKEDIDGTNVVNFASGVAAPVAWTEYPFSFTATSETTRICLRSDVASGSGLTCFFDNITDITSYELDGAYSCYYSWVAKYEDDSEYETDLSPETEIVVDNEQLLWTLPVSAATEVTHKRLYRAKSGIIYYLTEIENSETSYVDSLGDEDLILQDVFDRTGYYPPPDNMWYVTEHYRRLFCLVDGDYDHYLFWSEPEEPQAFIYDVDTGLYSGSTDVFRKGNRCMGMAGWGGDLFIASKTTFKRLVGSSPSYWSLRPTLATVGNLARYAMITTRFGILHLWWDGVYLFNAYNSTRITGKNTDFFENINWDASDAIRATCDQNTYRLFVPTGESTVPTAGFVLDLETYPKVRCYEETPSDDNGIYNASTNDRWYTSGTILGNRTNVSTAQTFEVHSKTFPTNQLLARDGVARLHYDIDTAGEDVSLTFYFDWEPIDAITLNTDGRVRGVESVPVSQAKTVSLKVSGTLTNNVRIFEPWILE